MDILKLLQKLGDAEIDDLSIAHDALEEIVHLRIRLAEVQKDAERYHWLKKECAYDYNPDYPNIPQLIHNTHTPSNWPTELDAAIDKAMLAAAPDSSTSDNNETEADYITQHYADGRRGDRRYTPARIAWEITRTALGDGHYGNSLRIAKDLECVGAQDRSLLDRWATGIEGGTDHVALQQLAFKIEQYYATSAGDE